jgi:Tfp pilus assembly protein PilX
MMVNDAAREARGRRGFVLVSVLWILAILTVVSLGFANRASLERKVAWYALDQAQAQNMARGAVELALVELGNKGVVDSYFAQAGYTGLDQRWAVLTDLFQGGKYFKEFSSEENTEDLCVYLITDCLSKVSINASSEDMLREVPGIGSRNVNRILRRRRRNVPEEELVQNFATIDEFRTEAKVDDRDWFGRGDKPGLRDLITAWGNGRININTASGEVLSFVPELEGSVADAIVGYRRGNDGELGTADDLAIKNIHELPELLGISAEKVGQLRQHCTTQSIFFTIEAMATRRRGKIRAYCSVVVLLSGARPRILYWREGSLES